ncbi:hypothetical protein FOA52_010498 [Chlamydomonas sp. UWO 241]|nr:hypothetical protein FOA52_010498 [Chlamydomonas sp. UWO 241]
MVQLPRELRRPVFALRAFNIESAVMGDQVQSKEAPVLMLRAQWWRDAIDSVFSGQQVPAHPVVTALAAVVRAQAEAAPGTRSSSSTTATTPLSAAVAAAKEAAAARGGQGDQPAPHGAHGARHAEPEDAHTHTDSCGHAHAAAPPVSPFGSGDAAAAPPAPLLRKYHLKRMIDTREADMLDGQPPLDMTGLEKYAEGTASQLMYLQLAAAGIASRDADHAASHLGKAVGLATLLKGTPFHAARRRSYLPLDLCSEHGVSQEDIYAGTVTEGLRDVALAIASASKANLEEARALCSRVPAAARPLFLPSLAVDAYLKALEKANFDPFDPSLSKGGVSPLWHVLQVKWHLMAETY